jgi:hypothetical protein
MCTGMSYCLCSVTVTPYTQLSWTKCYATVYRVPLWPVENNSVASVMSWNRCKSHYVNLLDKMKCKHHSNQGNSGTE